MRTQAWFPEGHGGGWKLKGPPASCCRHACLHLQPEMGWRPGAQRHPHRRCERSWLQHLSRGSWLCVQWERAWSDEDGCSHRSSCGASVSTIATPCAVGKGMQSRRSTSQSQRAGSSVWNRSYKPIVHVCIASCKRCCCAPLPVVLAACCGIPARATHTSPHLR